MKSSIGDGPDAPPSSGNIEVACGTNDMNKAFWTARLENHFLSMLIALGTNVMRWLAIAHAFLQRVDGSYLKHRNHGVSISLSRPVFKLHDLLFKLIFFAGQRRILLLYGRDQGIRINDCFLKLYELGIALRFVGSAGDVGPGLSETWDRGEQSGKWVCHSSSNVAHERPSRRAKPACEGPPRWAG
jgi:hypothetical protein